MTSLVGNRGPLSLGGITRNAVIVTNDSSSSSSSLSSLPSPSPPDSHHHHHHHLIKTEPGSGDRGTVLVDNTSPEARCKRRIAFAAYTGAGMQPASVARRNARERNRVKQVNNGFATLRNHIPLSVAAALGASTVPAAGRGQSKKLSKVETLKMAVEYIRSLKELLDESGGHSENFFKESKLELSPCSDASDSPPPSTSSYHSEPGYHAYSQEPMSPEDEELLDYISWWQQAQ